MDKRYKPITLAEQVKMRRQAVDDILSHPEWPLADAVVHIKKTLRLTTADFARMARISFRTMQDIELGRSQGTVKTLNSVLGVLGLRLGITKNEPLRAPQSENE